MARGGRGRLSDEEKALLAAQAASIPQELLLKQRQADMEAALGREKIGAERDIEANKLGFGREELGQKERASALAGALSLIDTDSKERLVRDKTLADQTSDLIAHRTDIPSSVLAETLARQGNPALYNANASATAAKRDALLRSFIPALQNPKFKNEDERAAKLKSVIDAQAGPEGYNDALALAFSKADNFKATKPQFFQPDGNPNTSGSNTGGGFGALLSTLLEKGGVAGGRSGGGATPTFAPEVSYTGLGHGSLEGSKEVAGGIQTPSGGFIGGTLSADRLAKLISPRDAAASVATTANVSPQDSSLMFRGHGAGSSWADAAGQLVGATPTPSMAPALVAQVTPSPTPELTPLTAEMRKRLLATGSY